MQISTVTAGQGGSSAFNFPGGILAATAALNAPAEEQALQQQLKAYQALASRWRESGPGERAALAPSLTDSPFAKRVQSTLDAFTRAAWAGPNAVPPDPQVKILKAFDDLSEADRQIVAAMQADRSGTPAYASAEAYRAKLQADLDALTPPAANDRKPDTITLSQQAQAHLAGKAPPPTPTADPNTNPQLAAALANYARAAG